MLDQKGRIGRLTTPLGPNVLALARLEGREAISEPFHFEVEAVAKDPDIDLDQLIGKPAHVLMDLTPSGQRSFHGLITDAHFVGGRDSLYVYSLTLRPWLWVLGKTTDCRIYHDKTVTEIVSDVFTRAGFADYRIATSGSFPTLHYTVQYRETDLNFVSRLMEQHGIAYYFEHADDKHTLVLVDSNNAYPTVGGFETVPFFPHLEEKNRMAKIHVHSWKVDRALKTGRVALNDYNHLTPTAKISAEVPANQPYAHADKEVFDFPGPHVDADQAGFYARVRLEAEQAADQHRFAEGSAIGLHPGAMVSLDRHLRKQENQRYLVLAIEHAFGEQAYRTSHQLHREKYEGRYELLPASTPYRPPATTEKPLIHSLHTALVTGADGEEIDVDDHGRILVHFYWDRHRDKSCRVRVSQVWAGSAWGGQIIPRIGMEVMVAYLEGDPDRPIVVGSVPNPKTQPVPYALPENKTRAVWRSNSYKSSGRNEVTMEDLTGRENLFVHAQKDESRRVLNNATERVDANHVSSVGANRVVDVGGNQKTEIGGSMNMVVGGTGGAALALMGQVAGLAGGTAGLLSEAGAIAGGGGAGLGAMAGSLASSALGFFSGGGLGGLSGVTAGADPTADAGNALRDAGAKIGEDAGGILAALPGVFNTVIGSFNTRSVGVADVQQVGLAKVTNVGATSLENVGQIKRLTVGQELRVEVGGGTDKDGNPQEAKSILIMKSNGDILLKGVKVYIEGEAHVQVISAMIDHN